MPISGSHGLTTGGPLVSRTGYPWCFAASRVPACGCGRLTRQSRCKGATPYGDRREPLVRGNLFSSHSEREGELTRLMGGEGAT